MIEAKHLINSYVYYKLYDIGKIKNIYVQDDAVKIDVAFCDGNQICHFDLKTCLEIKSLIFYVSNHTEIFLSLKNIKDSLKDTSGKTLNSTDKLINEQIITISEQTANRINVFWYKFPLCDASAKSQILDLIRFENEYNTLYGYLPKYDRQIFKKISYLPEIKNYNEQYRHWGRVP